MSARLRFLLILALLALPLAPRAADAATAGPGGGFDGDPATTERLNEGHPTYAAVEISKIRFGDDAASHVVLSRDDSFADSVAGSGLSGDGPLLLTARDELSDPTSAEIDRVLPAGGTVYLLGGTAAIAEGVARGLADRGFDVRRLAGASRVETAIAVADEVRRLHPGDDVLLARSTSWADSMSGGGLAAARDIPVLVTPTEALDPGVGAWLAHDAPATTTLLGGTAALSKRVEDAVPNGRRVSGVDRTATAAAVATELWGATDSGARRFVVANGLTDAGWTFGFAAAGLAADAGAPMLLVTDEVTAATADLVSSCGSPEVDIEVVGDGGVVPAPLREQLDAADGFACGPGGALVYPTDLSTFPACADVLSAFKQSALERVGPYGIDGFGGPIRTLEDPAVSAPAPGADAPATDSSGTSGTNVQEEGVDEPDVLKTNGELAYVVAQGRLQIVRVNAGAPTLVSTLALPSDGTNELLLSGDRLLVVTRAFSYIAFEVGGTSPGFAPIRSGKPTTVLTYVNVADPAHPVVDSKLEIDGDYRSARMIGSVARVVVQSDAVALPFVYPTEATPEAERDAEEQNRQVIEASTLDDWLPAYLTEDGTGQTTAQGALVDCADVRRPTLFSGLGTLSVTTIDLAGDIRPTSSAAVMAAGESVYASASRLYVTTGRWGWEPGAVGTGTSTEVHAFDISSPTATRYVASGKVPGYVLNPYALSEREGNLRIATTTEPPWKDDGTQAGQTGNGLYILDEVGNDLVQIGRVTGLGAGERIYAVRYFGDVAAVVTFKQVDPLFLVDLADPTHPRVTGELHIPGYSAYLHDIGGGRLVGVGRDATDDGMVTGMNVSVFDINDVSAPKLLDRVSYPNGYSPVEYDPHAFLYWPATGLSVVPLEEYDDRGAGFVGAVGIHAGDTVTEVGRATHTDDASGSNFYPAINRSFVTNGSVFTVSEVGIERDSLSTLAEEGWLGF